MALALDTSASLNTSSGSVAISITTTNGAGQIIVGIGTNAASVTSVTATGLTFSARKPYFAAGNFSGVAEYAANYTSNFSGTITVVVPTASFTSVDIFAISGCDLNSGITAPPYDSNGSLPASSATVASGTTSNGNDFVFACCGCSVTSPVQSGLWTKIPGSGTNFFISMYQIVSATGTYTPTISAGTIGGSVVDAIIQNTNNTLSAQIWI